MSSPLQRSDDCNDHDGFEFGDDDDGENQVSEAEGRTLYILYRLQQHSSFWANLSLFH